MNKYVLFVYGKLRRGGGLEMADNFSGSKLVGTATVNGLLYDLGDYPGLVLDGSGGRVKGEVYEIEDETMIELDAVEASADYHRKQAQVALGERKITCWIYLPNPNRCLDREVIASGDWIEYSNSR